MFGFIAKHRGIWPVAWMYDALGVSRTGFFAWLGRPQAARAKSDAIIGAKVRESAVRNAAHLGRDQSHHGLAERAQQ